MIYLMPESPRYLMKHGRYRKALEAFEQVQTTPLLASRDFMYAHAQLDFESRMLKGRANEYGTLAERVDNGVLSPPEGAPTPGSNRLWLENLGSQLSISPGRSARSSREDTTTNANVQSAPREPPPGPQGIAPNGDLRLGNADRRSSDISSMNFGPAIQRARKKNNPYSYHIGVTGYYKRLTELWQNHRCRRALVCASVAMLSQQLSGVNTIAFLSTIVWNNSFEAESSQSDRTAAIIGLAFGAANYVFGLPAYWLSDKIGRSNMLCIGLPNTAWSMLAFAFLFKIQDQSIRTPLFGVFAVIFVAFYAPTAGTSPFSISAEVFPLVSREAGMAVSVAVNLLGAGILVLVFPFLLNVIGGTSAFSIFAGLNLVAFVLVYLFVPETRMRTLEELQYTFDLPTRWHVAYRVGYIRRHVWENWWKYLTRKEVDAPIPFYEWARAMHGDGEVIG